MSKLERVDIVLAHQQPDRPPFSFWHHFGPDAVAGAAAVEAHVRHVEAYNVDFLKIMDDNRYPAPLTATGAVSSAAELDHLRVLSGDEDTFGRQLELIGALARRFGGQLRMATTV
jgi:uroporphyrinogen decarboxylase